MDLKPHGGITRSGVHKFTAIFGSSKVRLIECDRDIPYIPSQPYDPILVATHDLQFKPGISLLSKVTHLLSDLLSHHLHELLRCQVKDSSKRVLTAIYIGFTAQQGHLYVKSSVYAHGLCGLIETGLSQQCLSKAGQVMQFMSGDFIATALLGSPFSLFYANNIGSTRHTCFMSRLEDLLMLTDVGRPFATNLQLNFGPSKNVHLHGDLGDDIREGYDGHVTANVVMNREDLSSTAYVHVFQAGILDNEGRLSVTAILFSKRCVSDQTAIIEKNLFYTTRLLSVLNLFLSHLWKSSKMSISSSRRLNPVQS
jgi:hypothetical protein